MAKNKASPLDIMNTMGKAAHAKSQPMNDGDEDDMPPQKDGKNPKQAAAINEKKKGNAKAPKVPQSY